jgi:hypothetical protein
MGGSALRRLAAASLSLFLVMGVTLAAKVPGAGTGAKRGVSVAQTDRNAEQAKTLPITKKPGQAPKAVISIPAKRLGAFIAGDRIEAAGEEQVSVCLKPNTNHTSSRDDCVGRVYGFDPHIDAYLALASSRKAAKGNKLMPLTRKVKQECTQKQPNRNHHCVLTVPFGGANIGNASKLPCKPSACRVNLIMSAWHKGASRKDKVIIGGIDGHKIDYKGKGNISLVRYRPGGLPRTKPLVDKRPAHRKLGIVDEDKDVKLKVVYSVPVHNLRAGEALVIEGRYAASIKHLRYNVRARTQLVFGKSRHSTKDGGHSPAAVVADTGIEIDQQNNFNCTQGPSGHRSPCPIKKFGILRVKNSTNRTFYVNLIAGHGAVLESGQHAHGGDAARVQKSGYLKVSRYRP